MAVSKRLRFEVLRRDNHTCRYCGGSAPDVILTVDHVIPVALGGSDDPSNLVAACKDCNAGKTSSNPDAPLVDTVADDALRWAAAMKQAAEEFAREAASHPDVYAAVDAEWHRGNLPDNWTDSIDQFINAGLPVEVIVKMAQVAQNKRGEMGYRWSYFCGCCWKRVRQMQERAQEIAGVQVGVREPEPDSLLTTVWTTEELDWEASKTLEMPKIWLTQEEIDCAACQHCDTGHCGDPVCKIQHATILFWLAIQKQQQIFAQRERDEAVSDEAEAALDG